MAKTSRDPAQAPDPDSKSQRKRDMAALQALGEQLVTLREDQLHQLPMGERLLDTLLQAQKITQREARRRHLQLVGKLMRAEDAEAIAQAYERMQSGSRHERQVLHQLERWRDRLLAEGDAAIGEALQQFPTAESQPLRQLVRDARREQQQGKPPASARKLFQYLKQVWPSTLEEPAALPSQHEVPPRS